MKYVRLDVTTGAITRALVIPFPNDFVHSHVAAVLKVLCEETWPTASKIEVISAGECTLDIYKTFGRSGSLRLNAKPEDSRLLNASDYGAHYV